MLQRRIDDHAPPSRESMREAQEIFFKHLKRVGLKHTDQRDAILRTFLETRDHLSTDELFRLVRKKDAKIGFTTVYRTLNPHSASSLSVRETVVTPRSASPRFTARSSCWRNAGWPALSRFLTAWRAMSTSSIAATI